MSTQAKPHQTTARVNLRILIVEDDPFFMKIVSTLLNSNAGPVDAAFSSIKALEFLRTNPYDILITDLVMDGLNGADLVRIALLEGLIPKDKIMVVTGEAAGPQLEWIHRQGIRVLPKPFTAEQFHAALTETQADGANGDWTRSA